MTMLAELSLSHQGRHHSGIDDSRNIANIVIDLCNKGVCMRVTSEERYD